ncbi:hypothetical protein L1987_22113 [Smallanthus sonchifolius]|uniref:Uncharacterized protein n=1 Tax=Smallanthus sonchifolius TaxID=185202 RepID=A0ACB9IFF4_9ASTR|nr:hypothetical protein L1987_22113 [Smallanthus sonchifolius]
MLENPTDSSSTATVKRYAPPNQRNRALGRRKSGGDRLERASSYGNDGEKNQAAGLRNVPIMDHADLPQLIGLQGCCNSEAYQLLNNRWAAAMNAYENPSTDLAERPVMYSGSSASAWGQIRLPHQMFSPMAGVVPSGPQMDFISELRQAMHNSNAQF